MPQVRQAARRSTPCPHGSPSLLHPFTPSLHDGQRSRPEARGRGFTHRSVSGTFWDARYTVGARETLAGRRTATLKAMRGKPTWHEQRTVLKEPRLRPSLATSSALTWEPLLLRLALDTKRSPWQGHCPFTRQGRGRQEPRLCAVKTARHLAAGETFFFEVGTLLLASLFIKHPRSKTVEEKSKCAKTRVQEDMRVMP